MRFVAIDVETANAKYHSICQIGVVQFEDGHEVRSEAIYVDPSSPFAPMNVHIHGISEQHVLGARSFPEIHDWLVAWTSGQPVISHSHFDRSAVRLACEMHSLAPPVWDWYDSKAVAQRVWTDFPHGYSLKALASHLDIKFRHHDALHDARACGMIINRAMAETGCGLQELLRRPVNDVPAKTTVRRNGDGDGALFGETIVFTGELSVHRGVAADMAAKAGADVGQGVTKHTTMLVVGERDLMPGWETKSGKHLKAEALIEKGQPIRIVGEDDFMRLAAITE